VGPKEALREVLAAPIGAHLTRPDTRIIDADGWYRIITPSNHSASVNEIIRARIAPGEVDRTVDRILDDTRGRPFKWVIGPDTDPADELAGALRSRGLIETHARGMYAPSSLNVEAPLVVREVDDRELFILYSEVVGEGWGLDPAAYRADFERATSEHLLEPHLFLAFDGDTPIGGAALVDKRRSAYLSSAIVLPAFRGKGAYRALIAARLVKARALGRPIVTTQAREATSAPMLERFGFTTVCRLRVFNTQ
jgi:GNAT superfamily N-acetyltransferase